MAILSLTELPAPAKLNLFLHVVGRREDGYHLLQSVFALIDWCDTLHLERRSDGRLARHDLGPALPADDLCLRAARALQQASGSALGADISIDKRVPWGAGLGGGSSDAATVLLALNRLWDLHWPRARLAALALTLGADVPFFVGGHNAWVEGVGEQLTPIELPPLRFAVLKPAVAIPTQAIFGSSLLARDTPRAKLAVFLASLRIPGNGELAGFGRNDLQPPAMAHSGEVGQALELLKARYGNSRMSGSGSAVFAETGVGDSFDQAPPEASDIGRELPAGWVFRLCRGLERHPLADWLDP
ncbi:4-(cytidine 5'-diphospho)-2-C-methyl-D-erythritol kinase [Rivibacter subsaxonicus]|uniref:4-diphosphocytidyl-2-C-methyl-D-erythritol kinase n=1 Tax=Rivibacter subsaxonicus TaxID=457575 RepID=A0A4Q7VGA5_9BURK|nr:4-(cytidine 5'-diphospho)-2-C-methyl-D-erythritol kinase [Rivibacter subsaxonicus]RZT95053.1 4-diphosphocytidyl-2-C-methyl-D-erythritol kinase [Rivibacter subsaxonicus]